MVIYDLNCTRGHRFEGWFQDLEAYQAQAAGGQLECPACGSREISRTVTGTMIRRTAEDRAGMAAFPQPVPAPGGAAPGAGQPAAPATAITPQLVREFLMTLSSHVKASSEDVGARFAQEARLIHTGEAPERLIRGTSTAEEEQALEDDGIPFMKLPLVSADD